MSNLKDFATSTVVTIPSPADTGTSLVVQAGHGARFPAVPFSAVLHPPSEFPTLDNAEKIQVTAVSTDTFTIVRAQGGTTARSIEAGWRISNTLFLADIPTVDATSVDAAGATMNSDTNVKTNSWVVDEDNMTSNVDTKVPTQQSVKAYIDAAITATKAALYPVGSIYTNATDSTNPATLLGFGTWTAFAAGRVPVGKAASGTFATAGATGGEENHTLTITEMPNHSHTFKWRVNFPKGTGSLATNDLGGDALLVSDNMPGGNSSVGYDWGGGTDGNNATGGGGAHNNLQPYVVVYMWQRTA